MAPLLIELRNLFAGEVGTQPRQTVERRGAEAVDAGIGCGTDFATKGDQGNLAGPGRQRQDENDGDEG